MSFKYCWIQKDLPQTWHFYISICIFILHQVTARELSVFFLIDDSLVITDVGDKSKYNVKMEIYSINVMPAMRYILKNTFTNKFTLLRDFQTSATI